MKNIPRLRQEESVKPIVRSFIKVLTQKNIEVEIRTDFSTRLLMSTDNSVYQVIPSAVFFPKTTQSISDIFKCANVEPFNQLKFSPRGGGTGTNGQSLSSGIIIDCSKYLNKILEFNQNENWVEVEAGVVHDQLNSFLKPYGYFFAPTLSPSNRATIGGMINTDACGKGSRIYGKTSNHVNSLETVLFDGSVLHSESQQAITEAQSIADQNTFVGSIYKTVLETTLGKRKLIETTFPKLSRFLTGYNLKHAISDDSSSFNLNSIISGSEGTLGVVTKSRLKITPIPRFKKLVVVKYSSFDDALKSAQVLVDLDPSAIETIDEKVLSLAKNDEIIHKVGSFVSDVDGKETKAINLVEFIASDTQEYDKLSAKLNDLEKTFNRAPANEYVIGFHIIENSNDISSMWELRAKGVGLLGNLQGNRRPIPFVEDTAVPPENLADYIAEFRSVLEKFGLKYGMFGHVDVGCLHVRPALDLKTEQDERIFNQVTEEVLALVKKYKGIMWAEHGKGFRSEFIPDFFGEELFQELRKIKTVFDPQNKLNPGKIVTPIGSEEELVRVDSELKRGKRDREISSELHNDFSVSMYCNGNGACFNVQEHSIMCPSSKITRDRIHSPKGRSTLMKEWLRQISLKRKSLKRKEILKDKNFIVAPFHFLSRTINSIGKKIGLYDFSHEVADAMYGCLTCKACATQCPIKVDVPSFRSEFLAHYYQKYLRPIKEYFVGYIEHFGKFTTKAPSLFNFLQSNPLSTLLVKNLIGMVDIPKINSTPLKNYLRTHPHLKYKESVVQNLNENERSNSVILIQDAFTSFYESDLVVEIAEFLQKIGFRVFVHPFFPNGKPFHVKGFFSNFAKLANKNTITLSGLMKQKIPLVGIDPTIVLTYRDEYREFFNQDEDLKVLLLQEFLTDNLEKLKLDFNYAPQRSFSLFSLCTERTTAPKAEKQWIEVFQKFNQKLELVNLGCCGMCGTYGHETAHFDDSKGIYEMSWKKRIEQIENPNQSILATGYSCRSQVKRFEHHKPLHPAQILNRLI